MEILYIKTKESRSMKPISSSEYQAKATVLLKTRKSCVDLILVFCANFKDALNELLDNTLVNLKTKMFFFFQN